MRSEKLLIGLQSRINVLEKDLKLEREKNSKLEKEIQELKKPKSYTRSKSKKTSVKKSEE